MKLKVKKTTSKFWRIYFSVIICFFVLLLLGLFLLWNVLADYEGSLAKNTVKNVYDNYIVTENFVGLFSEVGSYSEFESIDTIADALATQCDGNTDLYKTSETEGSVEYSVRCGETKLLTITASKNGDTTKFGFDKYSITSIVPAYASKKIVVNVPVGYNLYINGISVGDKYIVSHNVESPYCDKMPEGVDGIRYNTFMVSDLLSDIEIASEFNGVKAKVVFDSATSIYTVMTLNDDKLQDTMEEYAVAAVKAYASYMQEDGSLNEVKKYFDTSSDVYKRIKSTQLWVLDHNGCSFENTEASEFYSYDENTFSCRIKTDQVLKAIRGDNYTDKVDLTLYFKKINGKFLVYELVNHE